MSFSISRSILNLLIIGCISIFIFVSCDELEPVNPADPAYTLTAPTLVSAQAITDVQIDIKWQDNEEHSEEFVIQRSSGSQSYITIANVSKDVLSYGDTSCTLGISYTYAIICKVESNISTISNAITTATVFPAATNISLHALSDEVMEISWNDNCSFEDGYNIERGTGTEFTLIIKVPANVESYADTGLDFGLDYIYRVAGYTESNISNWVSSNPTNTTFPAPTNLNATANSDSEIELTWVDNCIFEAGYQIERNSGSGFVELVEVEPNTLSYLDGGLDYGASYIYRTAAFTSANTSEWVYSLATNTIILAPTNLNVTATSDSEIELSWVDQSSFEDGYRIERNNDGSGYVEIAEVNADMTNYLDSGLEYGTNYVYRVAGFTESNVSSWVTSLSSNTVIQTPSDLTANATNDATIELSWTDNNGYEVGFVVERDSGAGFVEVAEISPSTLNYTDEGLQYGRDYGYRVAGFTAENKSAYSSIATTSTFIVGDFDGNVYAVIQIGNQTWMAENLKVTHYSDGTAIPTGFDDESWVNLSTGAYAIYNDQSLNSSNANIYGLLYNWFAVNNNYGLAPEGWHIPTDDEWKELELYLGMSQAEADRTSWRGTDEGGMLKESGLSHWNDPNAGASNAEGFTALPGGYRYYSPGEYYNLGNVGGFWSSTEGSISSAMHRMITYDTTLIYRSGANKPIGYSVRCIKD